MPSDCLHGNTATLLCIPSILENLLFYLFGLVGVAAVILVAYGGIKFILSGGDPKQVDGARKVLTYAIAGLVLVLMAYAIIGLISFVTGVGCIKGLNIGSCITQ